MQLVKYEAACRAVADARTIDEVQELMNGMEAARTYARLAKNRQMEIDAIEIRVRAERKLGEILGGMRKDGLFGQGRGGSVIKLSELGVDSNISGGAQRLAMLPAAKFESEITGWREETESSGVGKLTVPLQVYRKPSVRGDQQKCYHRRNPNRIDASDQFDRYRSPDGRRVVDWRVGELRRIKELAERVLRCVEVITGHMPVANADALATVEMVYRPAELLRLLEGVWAIPVDCGDAGLNQKRIDESRERRARHCETCGSEFVARNPSGQARAGKSKEGRFCSRECAHKAQKSIARGDDGKQQTEVTARG